MSSIIRSRLRALHHAHRHFSQQPSTPSPNPITISALARKQKLRDAISLLKLESDPTRIADIARSASLTPETRLGRSALSLTVFKLSNDSSPSSATALQSFLKEFTSRPDQRSEQSLSHAIFLYGQAGMLDQAVNTFRNLDKLGVSRRTTLSFNALLHACGLKKDHVQATYIFREFPKAYNTTPDITSYEQLLLCFCKSGKSGLAFEILDEMERKGIKPRATTYGIVLSGLYKEEKHKDAEKVLKMMGKNETGMDGSIHEVRIRSLCLAQKTSQAKDVFEEIVSSGVAPNSVLYFHLINGFCREGSLEEAMGVFHEMGEKGIEPGCASYFNLVYRLSMDGQFDAALQLTKEGMEKDWVPNFSTMKLLVAGLVKHSKLEEAKELVGKLKERFPNTADQLWKDPEGLKL
ncbi:hypothetical protein ACLOJK_039496 [Asimina triloba]